MSGPRSPSLVLYSARMAKAKTTFDWERFFQALGDRTRLRLLNLIGDDEVCVCYFVEGLDASQPKVSRHLAYLRRAGIVAARREGKWMHYRIETPADPHTARVFNEVMVWLAEEREMQQDRARMQSICCAPRLPVRLQGAPRPNTLSN